jgi:hypothetical protein
MSLEELLIKIWSQSCLVPFSEKAPLCYYYLLASCNACPGMEQVCKFGSLESAQEKERAICYKHF